MFTARMVLMLLVLFLCSSVHGITQNRPYRSLIASQSLNDFGNIVQGAFVTTSSVRSWTWRNFTGNLGDDIAGMTVTNHEDHLVIGLMNRSGILSADGRSFSILATNLTRCHYAIVFPAEHYMIYTDAGDHIYRVDLETKEQTILLDHVGGSAGTRGLVYDETNNWIYFSGAQLMRSRPDGTELQNITHHLHLDDANPGFQLALDSHVDPANPRVYLAFNGGLYMAAADGSEETLLYSSPVQSNYTGPYGVAIGVDPVDEKRYIYWCRGLRSTEAYLERSVLSSDGFLTAVESVWNETDAGSGRWLYTLALVPWQLI